MWSKTCVRMSEIAKSGFNAEKLIANDKIIRVKLETFFSKKIEEITLINRKKYDCIILFSDETYTRLQIKKIVSLTRSNSFDRRHISKTFINEFIRKYFVKLAYIKDMTPEQKNDFINICKNNIPDILHYIFKTLIGTDKSRNDYFLIIFNNEIYILNSTTLFDFIEKNIRIFISNKEKATCLYLTDNIYIQRKGAAKTDDRSNDVQAKLKITQKLLDICIKL